MHNVMYIATKLTIDMIMMIDHDVMYRIKPEELYIFSCKKGRGRMAVFAYL